MNALKLLKFHLKEKQKDFTTGMIGVKATASTGTA